MPGGAADDADTTERALVRVQRPRVQRAAQDVWGAIDVSRRGDQRLDGKAEVAHVQLTAVIRAFQREQARLERDEGDGVVGPDRAPQHPSAVGVQSAGDVDGQHRARLAVDVLDQLRVASGDIALQTDAEQRIDHQIEVAIGQLGSISCRRGQPGVVSGSRIVGQPGPLAGEHDRHPIPPRLQMTGQHESVAAVVAGAGQHEHRPGFAEQTIARELGGGESGALHQRRRVRLRAGERLDPAHIGGEIHRQGIRGEHRAAV